MLSQSEQRKPPPPKKKQQQQQQQQLLNILCKYILQTVMVTANLSVKHTVGLCFLIQEYLSNRLR